MTLANLANRMFEKVRTSSRAIGRAVALTTVLAAAGVTGCKKDHDGVVPVQNYWLKVLDAQDNPVQGARVSLHDAALYDIDTDVGEWPEPKPATGGFSSAQGPDGVSNAQGDVFFLFPDDKQYNVVIEHDAHLTKRHFKLNNEQTANSPNFTTAVAPGAPGRISFEGHILHDEHFPQEENNYTPGEKVKFIMKGVNNHPTETSIGTFKVYRDLPGNNDPLVYASSETNPLESLVAAPGTKPHTVMEWILTKAVVDAYGNGKYKINADWKEENVQHSHLIGIFRAIVDSTPPTVNGVTNVTRFTNEAADAGYVIQDTPQPGSVRAAGYQVESIDGSTPANVDLDTAVGGAYDADMAATGTPVTLPPRGEVLSPQADVGKNAKVYTVRIWAEDTSGNRGYVEVIDTNHLTKAEADALSNPIYDAFKIGPSYDINFFTDYGINTAATPTVFPVNCNKINTSYIVGHNYNRQSGLTEAQAAELNGVISGLSGPEYVKPIDRSTKADFLATLTAFMQALKDAGYLPP